MANGNKLIRKHSLSGDRLRNHTLTGKQVNASKVPDISSVSLDGITFRTAQ